MLQMLKAKREECVEEIADLESELEKAKARLELVDELLTEANDLIEEAAEENAETL